MLVAGPNYLQKLALVNCNFSERALNLITEYAAKSNFIEDFDLSWNRAPRTVWTQFFETFKTNKKIR